MIKGKKQKKMPVLDITMYWILRCIGYYDVLDITMYWILRCIGYYDVLDITIFFSWVRMRQKKPLISNTGNFFCFNSNVSNLYNKGDVEKTNGMTFNQTTTSKLIYWFIYHQSSVHSNKCQVLKVIIYIYTLMYP
jgi:hypothetical protein